MHTGAILVDLRKERLHILRVRVDAGEHVARRPERAVRAGGAVDHFTSAAAHAPGTSHRRDAYDGAKQRHGPGPLPHALCP